MSISLVPVLGVVHSPAWAATTEFVTNTSVETALAPWNSAYNTSSQVQRTTGGLDGTYAVRVSNSATASGDVGFRDSPSNVSSSVAGRVYDLSVWVRSEVAGRTINLEVEELTSAGSSPGALTQPFLAPDTGWHRIALSYVARGSGNDLSFIVYASSVSPDQGFWADLFSASFTTTEPTPTETPTPTPTQVVDRAVAAGVNVGDTPTWDVCVGDWNGDGRDDFHVSRHMLYEGALFVQNSSRNFNRQLAGVISPKVVKRTQPRHTGVDRHGCVMADFDRNGLTDAYTTAGRYASNRVKHEAIDNELFMQMAPGVIEDWAIRAGVNEPCHRSRQAAAPDWNGDGWPDLIVGAQRERNISTDPCNQMAGYPYIEQSHVYLNNGDPDGDGIWNGFRLAPAFNVSTPNVGVDMALAWDQNRDGRPDLLSLDSQNRRALLFRNSGTGFTEVSQQSNIRLPYLNHAAIGDVTGDGIDDFVFADNSGFAYRAGTAMGISTTSFRIASALPSAADGWKVALGDVDGDGDTDVYGQTNSSISTVNPDDLVYLNDGFSGTSLSFSAMPVPSSVGASNDVAAVMVGSRAQFVVLNGGNEEKEVFGPIQLIALTP